ncbi:MAG: hypothetical protein PHR64_00055 [Candidatus Shapirobacteria bacterium]|nr:hypothetical protein [Candidatus Shapirobacteria bacterium]MDD5073578.1 hypothetical protein [Candidatus Shapirobacteria bacterium]MDD5481331.1 hypothetical protein [Candidatus Shapirobacteria bacterium]
MSENESLPPKGKKPAPPKTDSSRDWEEYLTKMDMPGELSRDPREVDMATMAEFGKKNRPADYDPQNDLYIGDIRELIDEDVTQCDGRIGVNGAQRSPGKFEQFLKQEERRGKRRV